jgi:hypothetical protein
MAPKKADTLDREDKYIKAMEYYQEIEANGGNPSVYGNMEA